MCANKSRACIYVLVLCSLVSFAGCALTGRRDVNSIPVSADKLMRSVAVLPFANNTTDHSLDSLGATMADIVATNIVSPKSITVIERQKIVDLLSELKFNQTGAVNSDTAVKIGKVLGANMMVFGSFVQVNNKVILSVRVVKTETSEVVGGITEETEGTSSINSLAGRVGKRIAKVLDN